MLANVVWQGMGMSIEIYYVALMACQKDYGVIQRSIESILENVIDFGI